MVVNIYRRIATLEAETKDMLGNIRKSKPLLQDFCLLGIGQGAPPEFVEKCSALEAHYSSQLLQGARPVSPSSNSSSEAVGAGGEKCLVQWAHQMCVLWGQQTSLIRQVIDKAEKKGGIDDSSIRQVRPFGRKEGRRRDQWSPQRADAGGSVGACIIWLCVVSNLCHHRTSCTSLTPFSFDIIDPSAQIRSVLLNELGIFVERVMQILEPLESILSEDYTLARTDSSTTADEVEDEDEEENDEDNETAPPADMGEEVVQMCAQEKQLRSAIQVFLLAIADMGRLQLLYTVTEKDSGSVGDSGSGDYLCSLKQQQVQTYRQRALTVAPHDGAPFASLSKMALRADSGPADTDTGANKTKKKLNDGAFLSAYYLARGMGAEVRFMCVLCYCMFLCFLVIISCPSRLCSTTSPSPPHGLTDSLTDLQEPYLAAREALLDIFEDQKSLSDSLESVTALSRLTLTDHRQRYQAHFLAAVGVAYSRTGADRLGYHLTKARRHVGSMLQLVSTSQFSEQNRGGKGSFASFDQKAFQKQQEAVTGVHVGLEEKQVVQCREVDVCLCQSLVLALALIESVGTAHDIHRVCAESQWPAAYANWIDQGAGDQAWTLEDHIAHLSVEERHGIEQRYVQQRLHRLQSMPGLMDLLRLVVGLLASLLGTESIGSSLDSERRAGAICIYEVRFFLFMNCC